MATPRMKIVASPKSALDLATLKAAVQTEIQSKEVVEVKADWKEGAGLAVYDVAMGKEAEMDLLSDWVSSNKALLASLGPGTIVSFHLCSHDDKEVVSCKDHPSSKYQEVKV